VVWVVENERQIMKQQGMSLIEVMVAVAILATGLLGLGALQTRSIMFNQSAHYRSIAADLASDLADRIRANRNPVQSWDSVLAGATADFPLPPNFAKCPQNNTPDVAPVCTTQDAGRQTYRVQSEMTEWNTNLRSQMRNLNATYTLVSSNADNGFYRYVLTIQWLDDRSAGTNSSYVAVIE
jgi:type IV pilus assembly protein PilV